MDKLFFGAFLACLVIGTTVAAPWVVLDSGSDMLAMSSEVSEREVVVVAPPEAVPNESEEDKSVEMQIQNAKAPEKDVPQEKKHYIIVIATTSHPKQSESTPAPVANNVGEEKKSEDSAQTTVGTPELMETTTATIGDLVESDLKQEDIDIEVFPESPTFPDPHPNSIEDDISLEPIILISKRKHSIFNSKGNFRF